MLGFLLGIDLSAASAPGPRPTPASSASASASADSKMEEEYEEEEEGDSADFTAGTPFRHTPSFVAGTCTALSTRPRVLPVTRRGPLSVMTCCVCAL